MLPYKDYATPNYTPNLGDRGKGFLAGAFLYVPLVITVDDLPGVDVVGVEGALSCIGIIARDPASKTILVFHMKEPRDRAVSFALLNFAYKSGFTPSADREKIETLLLHISEDKSSQNTYTRQAYDYLKANDFFKNIQFTVVNTNPRSYDEFLSMLENVGVRKNNIAIDNGTDKILINRETGELCCEFDVDKTKLPPSKETVEEQLKETLLVQRQAELDAAFLAMPLHDKISRLMNEKILSVKDKRLLFGLDKTMQSYANILTPSFYGELLAYFSEHHGINALNIYMLETHSMHTYQDIPRLLIESLDRHPAIHTLSIQSLPRIKTNYLSDYAVRAAEALQEHGQYLKSVTVVANTRGVDSFNKAVNSLKKQHEDLVADITLCSGTVSKPSVK